MAAFPDQTHELVTKVSKLQSLVYVHLFDVRAPVLALRETEMDRSICQSVYQCLNGNVMHDRQTGRKTDTKVRSPV